MGYLDLVVLSIPIETIAGSVTLMSIFYAEWLNSNTDAANKFDIAFFLYIHINCFLSNGI